MGVTTTCFDLSSFLSNQTLLRQTSKWRSQSKRVVLRSMCWHYYNCYIYIYIYIYIYSADLKRLTTPSDFHIPLPSIVPFAHSQISSIHDCIYSIFPGSPGTASFFPSFRFPVNHNFCQSRWVHSLDMTIPNKFFSGLSHPISYFARPFFL